MSHKLSMRLGIAAQTIKGTDLLARTPSGAYCKTRSTLSNSPMAIGNGQKPNVNLLLATSYGIKLGKPESVMERHQRTALPKLLDRKCWTNWPNFLGTSVGPWKETNQEQRNRLTRQLSDEIWVKGKEVMAVKPRPELKPFFDLNYEATQENPSPKIGKWRPRGDLNP